MFVVQQVGHDVTTAISVELLNVKTESDIWRKLMLRKRERDREREGCEILKKAMKDGKNWKNDEKCLDEWR